MKEVILVDPHTGGHHLSYIRIYATVFAGLGCKVAILSPDVAGLNESLSSVIGVHGGSVEVCELPRRKESAFEKRNARKSGIVSDLLKSYFSYRDFIDIHTSIKKNKLNKSSLIFILWLDTYISRYLPAVLVDLILPYGFAGLYFHPSRVMSKERNGAKHVGLTFFVPMFRSKKLRFVGLFDEKITLSLRDVYKKDIFNTLPDIAEKHALDMNDELVQRVLWKARNRKIISLVGSLEKRKNLLSFFDAASESDGDVFFVCAGEFYKNWFSEVELEKIDRIARECADKLFFYDNYIDSDRRFDSLFSISSIVFAAYVNFPSSSNMIVKSSLHGVPVIVSKGHLMGELVDKYELGISLHEVTAKTILSSVEQLLEENMAFGFSRFIHEHSFEELEKRLSRIV